MLKRWSFVIIALGLITLGAHTINAQEQPSEFTGYMGDDVNDDYYPVELVAGNVITVEAFAVSGNLDPYLFLQSPTDNMVMENDDRGDGTLNSAFTYAASMDGTYQVIVSNIIETSGDYRLTIQITDADTSGGESSGSSTGGPVTVGSDAEDGIPFTANALQHTGYMGDDVSDARYPIEIQAGETIRAVAVAATGSELDTFLLLEDSAGNRVIENDDRGDGTFNSQLIFTAETGGAYTIVISNYPATSGNYELVIDVLDEAAAADLLGNMADLQRGILFSGPPLTRETEHFVIHYTLEGNDATTEEYVEVAAQSLEEVWQIQIVDAGWPAPPPDDGLGGDDRIDVYISDLLKASDEGALGEASGGDVYMDNPNTPEIEETATYSYYTLDNRLDEENTEGVVPYSLLRATIAHEFHHGIQYGYDSTDSHNWYYEATASWMETFTYPKEQDATGYVADNFGYPEICFGVSDAADPTGGLLMYGDWMFIQSMADAYGLQVVPELWQNIALEDGFAALETTFAAYGEDIPTAVARYRLQNLARDYELAPLFEKTVWLENTITSSGTWYPTGNGIQEMGANYFRLSLSAGVYVVSPADADDMNLQLWGVGIRGQEADALLLGSEGIIDTTGYDDYYVMVFNPTYDDDVEACDYQTYRIDIQAGTGTVAPTVYTWDAAQFEALN